MKKDFCLVHDETIMVGSRVFYNNEISKYEGIMGTVVNQDIHSSGLTYYYVIWDEMGIAPGPWLKDYLTLEIKWKG